MHRVPALLPALAALACLAAAPPAAAGDRYYHMGYEVIQVIDGDTDAIVADMWSLRELSDPRMWAQDRLHFSPIGHHTIARMALGALNVENDLEPLKPEPLPAVSWRQARVEDIGWAREHLVPWVLRRIRHQSSGDGVQPKRPGFQPVGEVDAS